MFNSYIVLSILFMYFTLTSIYSKPMSAILAVMLLLSVFTNTVTTTIFAEMLLSIMLTFRSGICLLYGSVVIQDLLLIYNMHYPFKPLFGSNQKIKVKSVFKGYYTLLCI